MIQIKFATEDINIFLRDRYYHPHVMRKMEVLFLKSLDLPHDLICRIGGVSPNTMRSYFKEYIEGGIEKVQEINFYRPKSDLANYTPEFGISLPQNKTKNGVIFKYFCYLCSCISNN